MNEQPAITEGMRVKIIKNDLKGTVLHVVKMNGVCIDRDGISDLPSYQLVSVDVGEKFPHVVEPQDIIILDNQEDE